MNRLSALRPWLVLGVLVLLFVAARVFGANEWIEVENLRAWVEHAGPWGPLVYVTVFVAGVTLQVPGVVFLVAAPVLFPPIPGLALALVGANVGVNVAFLVVRTVGGRVGRAPSWSVLRGLLDHLDERPIRTVALIRMLVLMFPPVTAALALGSVRARDHALGTLLGLTPPLTAVIAAQIWALGSG